MRSSGGGGAAFTAKRRAYGPGAGGVGAAAVCRRWCSPQSAGFLVVIAGVWVTVLLVFGTAAFSSVDKTKAGSGGGSSGGGWSFLSSSSSGGEGKQHVEPSALRALEKEVAGLSRRVDALAGQQARLPLDLPVLTTEKGVFGKKQEQPPKPAAAAAGAGAGKGSKGGKGPREGKFNSGTSAKPLVDPTVLTRSKPAFEHGDMEGLCRHRNDGDEDVLDRVSVWEGAAMGKPRILCLTYTLQKYHDSAVQSVRRTWAQKCDGYIAMSDFTDPDIPSVDIKHDGPEAYDNMWQVGWLFYRAALMYTLSVHTM